MRDNNQNNKHPLVRLLLYARNYRSRIYSAIFFSILNKIFDLMPPALIGAAVDVVVAQEESFIAKLGIVDVSNQLWVLGGITILVWAFESLFQYLYEVKWRNLAQAIQYELRNDAFAHVQGLDLAYFEDQSTGGLMAILNDDINQLERFLDVGANDVLQVLTTVIVISALFFGAAPSVAWLSMLPIPVIVWWSLKWQKQLAPRYADVRSSVEMLSAQLSNSLSGIATIKSFTAEQHEINKIREQSDGYQISNQRAIALSAMFTPMIRMIIVIGFTVMLVFGGDLALQGSLNIGVYSVLIFMTQRLLWPLTRLGTTIDLYQRAMASTTRVLDLLKIEPKITDGSRFLPKETIKGRVDFEAVSFIYKNGSSVLRELDFQIPAGATVAVVGVTGAGKSTLVKLLLRFYDVTKGAIMIDGIDLRDLKIKDLRSAVGFVSQDVFLFHGTVKDNICYGTFDAPMDKIIDAAKIAEAHDFIVSLPDGYDTIVGERGQKLSGGQRQRISLARAILKNPPILVLDEATSSVDNETEAAIQRSLEKIVVGRTTIVIAHRLSTIRNADQIVVLDQGEIVETGTHEELLDGNGIYSNLWRVQTGVRESAN